MCLIGNSRELEMPAHVKNALRSAHACLNQRRARHAKASFITTPTITAATRTTASTVTAAMQLQPRHSHSYSRHSHHCMHRHSRHPPPIGRYSIKCEPATLLSASRTESSTTGLPESSRYAPCAGQDGSTQAGQQQHEAKECISNSQHTASEKSPKRHSPCRMGDRMYKPTETYSCRVNCLQRNAHMHTHTRA